MTPYGEIALDKETMKKYEEEWANIMKLDNPFEKNDRVWYLVYVVCHNLVLSYIKKRNLHLDNDVVEQRVLDSTIYVIDLMKRKGERPRKLTSYCYWPMFSKMTNKQAREDDFNKIPYDEFLTNKIIYEGEIYED